MICCRLFGNGKTQLSSSGYSDWKNIHAHLKQHEKSDEHITNMKKWHTLSDRLQTNIAIDQTSQDLIKAEVTRWEGLVAIVTHLSERNITFRGHREKLYEHGNGNFLGQVELLAKFDLFMKEHLRLQEKEISDTHLSMTIQNELIGVIAQGITDVIVERVKRQITMQLSWTAHWMLAMLNSFQ